MVLNVIQKKKIIITVSGYNIPTTHIASVNNITPKQKKLFADWNNCK